MSNLKLTIENPCSENWAQFEPRPEGGHCDRCAKTVIDFTRFTDAQLIAYLKSADQPVCGRFRSAQLTTYALPTEPLFLTMKPGLGLLKASVLMLLLGLAGSATAQAQTAFRAATNQTATQRQSMNPASRTISGIVRDETGQPLPGVNVVVLNTSRGTVTNAEGYFELTQINEGDVLVFSFIGYMTTSHIIKFDNLNIEIPLKMDVELLSEMVVMGTVAIEEPAVKPKTSVWSVVRSWFRR